MLILPIAFLGIESGSILTVLGSEYLGILSAHQVISPSCVRCEPSDKTTNAANSCPYTTTTEQNVYINKIDIVWWMSIKKPIGYSEII